MVRLPAGVSPDAGRHQLEAALVAMIRAQAPDARIAPVVELVPVREIYAGRIRLRLLLVLAASALLLVTACVSLANLLLARAASHGNEFATRIALGASRVRILSLTFAHTLVLTIIAGAVGIALAVYGADALARYGPDDVRSLTTTRQTLPLVACAFAISLLTGIMLWRISSLAGVPKQCADGAAGRWSNVERRRTCGPLSKRAGRRRNVSRDGAAGVGRVVVAQLRQRDDGRARLPGRAHSDDRSVAVGAALCRCRAGACAFYRELVDRVRALPGVLSAGAISDLPAVRAESGASRTIFYTADTDATRR